MVRPQAKGWCPTTLVPMQSGDGLIVRVKPPYGRLTAAQAQGVADISARYGNGFIDITSRANLQIRGVSEPSLPSVITQLTALDLASADAARDRLSLIVAPFTEPHMLGWQCAQKLYEAASSLPEVPAKFGFAIDTGTRRYLENASADVRLETDEAGALLIRCDGQQTGFKTSLDTLISDINTLLRWYLDQQEEGQRLPRMAKLSAICPVPEAFTGIMPRHSCVEIGVAAGLETAADKAVIAVPFGQCDADSLALLGQQTTEIVVTINRCLIVDAKARKIGGFIAEPQDGRLAIIACPGAPACASATMETRPLAEQLAEKLAEHYASSDHPSHDKIYHISGCTKGCAAPRATDFCIIGTDKDYAVIENGCAWEHPSITSLSGDALFEILTKRKGA